jgi:hypothetical protein
MLQRLVEQFRAVDRLPIEIDEIREAVLSLGVQDEVIFRADPEMDVSRLRGVFYQYRYRPSLYGESQNVTLIVYPENVPVAWQRMICCKELIHTFDDHVERTDTLEELGGLITRLLGPLSVDEISIIDLMAFKDRLALYQAIPLLFPFAARNRTLAEISGGTKDLQQVADEACLPIELIKLVMSDDWPRLAEDLVRSSDE